MVRFSQALGFEGYPELQQAAIEEYRNSIAGGNGGASNGGALFSFDHSELEGSLGADYANLEETARKLTREQVETSVAALANAQRVVIVGVDQMAFFASYLRHTLSLLDIRAEIVASTGGESLQRLGRIDEDTLVIVLSAGRAHPLLLRAMKLALHRRARTLAISDASMSEVGEHAELTLYFSSNSPSFARSNTALMALVQALAAWSLRAGRSCAQRPHSRLQTEVGPGRWPRVLSRGCGRCSGSVLGPLPAPSA